MKLTIIALLGTAFFATACTQQSGNKKPMETNDKKPTEPSKKVVKTDAEWRKLLTPEQYRIARQAGTERAFNATYEQYKKQGAGTYYCAACDAKLFHSKTKINANCGWPAFYDAEKHENITTKEDLSAGMKRVEVLCAKCDAHLGHVFEGEGYKTPTDKRYCINGIILKFVPDKKDKTDKKVETANKVEADKKKK